MRPSRIVFAAAESVPGSDTRMLHAVLESWPGALPPEVVRRALHDAAELDRSKDAADACLVILGSDTTALTVDRIVEAMLTKNVGAVILAPRAADWIPLQRHGVVVLPWTAEATTVAGVLFGLAERQSAVDMLTREISQSERSAGGIRETIEHLHDELHLAASIQRDFTLAPLPRVDGLDAEVLFRPVNFVSGDVYAVHPLGDGLLGFFVADAVGHGVPAAMLTMVLTNSLTTTEATDGQRLPRVLGPGEVLTRLNDRLTDGCLGPGRFATAVYGLIDTKRRRVTIAGAGHPPPVVVSPRGVRAIDTEGPLLAVFQNATFTEKSFDLAFDETLVVYTDGLEAAFPYEPTRPGLPRLAKHLEQLLRLAGDRHATPLREIVADLTSLLDVQDGSLHRADDVTALVVAWSREADSPSLAAQAA